MKKCIYLLLFAIAIGFSSCYPSDPEVSPFVGKWQDKKGTIIRITNDYIFFDAELRPTLRYTTDDKNFYLVSTKLESYKRECAYSYNNGVLYIQKFIENEMYEGHRDAVLTRVEK